MVRNKRITAIEKCERLVNKHYVKKRIVLKNKLLDAEIISNISSNSRVLDAGCGHGAVLISRYCDMIKEAVGVDLIQKFRVKPKVKTYTANLESLPFEDDYFDIIISKEVCEHLVNPLKVFKELKRILKPGGEIIILTPNKYCYSSFVSNLLPTYLKTFYLKKVFGANAYDNFRTFYRCNTKQQIRKTAEKSGLIIEKLIAIRHYPYYLMFSVILFRIGILCDMLISALGLDCLKSSFLFVLAKKDS